MYGVRALDQRDDRERYRDYERNSDSAEDHPAAPACRVPAGLHELCLKFGRRRLLGGRLGEPALRILELVAAQQPRAVVIGAIPVDRLVRESGVGLHMVEVGVERL